MELNLNVEEWVVIPNYPKYEASTMGRIRNKKTGKIISQFRRNKNLYLNVGLAFDKNLPRTTTKPCAQLMVHQVMAMAFIPEYDRSNREMVVHHLDHNKHNNRFDNLRWVTRAENSQASVEHKKSLKD
jgi:hypothetical protein